MSKFTETLTVSPLGGSREWITRREFGYDIGTEGSGKTIEVPIGFITDFASVPRIFWVFIPQWGRYGNAAVIHDYLYWEQTPYTRKESDVIFLEGMEVLKVGWFVRNLMYWMVRWFGKLAWNGNKKKKAQGYNMFAQDREIKAFEKAKHVRVMIQTEQKSV
jgi:hypothetical protein